MGAARPGLTSSISYTATNLLEEIMNTLKLFCPARPHNQGGKLKSDGNMQLKRMDITTMRLNQYQMQVVSQNGRLAKIKTQSQSLKVSIKMTRIEPF